MSFSALQQMKVHIKLDALDHRIKVIQNLNNLTGLELLRSRWEYASV